MNHEHKFFIFQVKADFEPLPVEMVDVDNDGKYTNVNKDLYRRVEYATLGCNCSEVIKRKVKNGDETERGE